MKFNLSMFIIYLLLAFLHTTPMAFVLYIIAGVLYLTK